MVTGDASLPSALAGSRASAADRARAHTCQHIYSVLTQLTSGRFRTMAMVRPKQATERAFTFGP